MQADNGFNNEPSIKESIEISINKLVSMFDITEEELANDLADR